MFLLIDKPKGITSHDVVDRVREITGEKRVGHAGTLDPNATGLLIVGIGRESTKKLSSFTKNAKKEYEAEICLGTTTDTDDTEGEVIRTVNLRKTPKMDKVREAIYGFANEIYQIPPKYSAIKIKGKKAYRLAREGKDIKMKPRRVMIFYIGATKYRYPLLWIRTVVSSGTYIRALARDIGDSLLIGGHLRELRRTKIEDYDVRNAVKLDDLNKENWKSMAFDI